VIASLRGTLLEKTPDYVVLEASGVGYHVAISLPSFYDLPEIGQPARLIVHTHGGPEGMALFGFTRPEEREMFRRLISVSGIGPKLARNILSGIRVAALVDALRTGDLKRIYAVPGVGKKLAERILVELRGKTDDILAPEGAAVPADPLSAQVVAALVNLGYKQDLALKAVRQVQESAAGAGDLEGLLRAALQTLAK
jgi:holliday junction DNA helicase RuvA